MCVGSVSLSRARTLGPLGPALPLLFLLSLTLPLYLALARSDCSTVMTPHPERPR